MLIYAECARHHSHVSQDLVAVTGLLHVREQLMDLKETLLETCVSELKEIIIGGRAVYDVLSVELQL